MRGRVYGGATSQTPRRRFVVPSVDACSARLPTKAYHFLSSKVVLNAFTACLPPFKKFSFVFNFNDLPLVMNKPFFQKIMPIQNHNMRVLYKTF